MGILNSMADRLSSETLGEINSMPKPIKPMKPKKNILIQPIQNQVPQMPQIQEEVPSIPSNPSKKYPVLEMLGIDFEPDICNLTTPEDMDNVVFDMSAPTGLNPDQVEQFFNKIQSDLAIYRNIIDNRQKDFIILLEQINSLTDKIVEHNQEQELASYIVDDNGQEVERLKNELVNLRLENSELKSQIINSQTNTISQANRFLRR